MRYIVLLVFVALLVLPAFAAEIDIQTDLNNKHAFTGQTNVGTFLAGAIKDHGRGKIVGTRSYGKGSVQGIFPLSTSGAGIRLTTAKFFSPENHAISKVGVQPDIDPHLAARVTPGRAVSKTAVSKTTEDPILSAGLRAARLQLASR